MKITPECKYGEEEKCCKECFRREMFQGRYVGCRSSSCSCHKKVKYCCEKCTTINDKGEIKRTLGCIDPNNCLCHKEDKNNDDLQGQNDISEATAVHPADKAVSICCNAPRDIQKARMSETTFLRAYICENCGKPFIPQPQVSDEWDWREEFDARFSKVNEETARFMLQKHSHEILVDNTAIKDFISQVESKAIERTKGDIKKKILASFDSAGGLGGRKHFEMIIDEALSSNKK